MQVYSFGVVLWEMLTRQSPFTGLAAYQVVEAVVQRGERPPWPAPDAGDAPIFPPLKILAERCWQSEPTLRPTFSDVVEELRVMADPQGTIRLPATNISDMTDESDELELALRQQKRRSRAVKADQISYVSSSEPDSVHYTGPPKDQLGRMLYFLAQVSSRQILTSIQCLLVLNRAYWGTNVEYI